MLNILKMSVSRAILPLFLLLVPVSRGNAQVSLSLSSGMAPTGGNVALELSLASALSQPAGLEWTF